VRRKEPSDVIVEERQSGRAHTEAVRGEVELATFDRRRELRGPVGPIVARIETGQPVNVYRRVASQLLAEIEVRGLAPKVATLERLETLRGAVECVGAGRQSVDRIDDEVRLRLDPGIGVNRGRGGLQHRTQLG